MKVEIRFRAGVGSRRDLRLEHGTADGGHEQDNDYRGVAAFGFHTVSQ